MFFYELREGDENIFADVLLVREEEMDADSFFELVQEIRRRVQDTFTQDTLIEAVGCAVASISRRPTWCPRRWVAPAVNWPMQPRSSSPVLRVTKQPR